MKSQTKTLRALNSCLSLMAAACFEGVIRGGLDDAYIR
jgi:hypothetical protein